MTTLEIEHEPVLISAGTTTLTGLLDVPAGAKAAVIIANGLGRMKNPIAEPFASQLSEAGFATLQFDVLTPDEAQFDSRTNHFSGDTEFQSDRIRDVVEWIRENPSTHRCAIVGVAAGAAARGMLHAAGVSPNTFQALVIDGGVRPSDVPAGVTVPTLVLVDDQLRRAQRVTEALAGPARLQIISSADVAGAVDPFFSDTAGPLVTRWLLDVFALARMELDDRVEE